MVSSFFPESAAAPAFAARRAAEARPGAHPETDAFAAPTVGAHARSGARPLPPDEALAQWQALREQPGPEGPRAVYVHLPFCVHRCVFCPFYRYASTPDAIAAYLRHLQREIAQAAATPLYTARPIDAVYLGGGTPSDLTGEQLAALLRALRTRLPLAPDCEITVEGRAASFTHEKLQAVAAEGANRISLGVQTFDGAARRRLGRILDRDALLARLRELSGDPRVTLCVDLIYGLPGQGLEAWRKELATLLDESTAHAWDAYRLKTFPQSPLVRLVEAGKLQSLPARSEILPYVSILHETMRTTASRRLSIYHWSRDDRERSRYNFLAKTAPVLLPLGAGAGGHVGAWQIMQHGAIEAYAAAIDRGEPPLGGIAAGSDRWLAGRAVAAGAEHCGWSLPTLEHAAGRVGLAEFLEPLLVQWEQSGLVTHTGRGHYALTPAGEFWNVEMQQRLISVIEASNPHSA